MSLRRKIYEVIEVADKDDRDSLIYDRFMLVCIAASIVPLCFKETNSLFIWLGRIVSMTSSFMGNRHRRAAHRYHYGGLHARAQP